MPYIVVTVLVLVLVYLPSLWVRLVMRRYGQQREDLPGTGGELAKHLVKRFELASVVVEETTEGNDHYDPAACAVRLGPNNFRGKSLTAVAVAAHEVGHAIQFTRGERICQLRRKFIPPAIRLKKIGILLLALLPIVGLVVQSPAAMVALVIASMALQLLGALAYLIVLPEEWDASFSKAMPILADGEYVSAQDMPGVHNVLRAAALTYVASALADLLNIGRWLLILRR